MRLCASARLSSLAELGGMAQFRTPLALSSEEEEILAIEETARVEWLR